MSGTRSKAERARILVAVLAVAAGTAAIGRAWTHRTRTSSVAEDVAFLQGVRVLSLHRGGQAPNSPRLEFELDATERERILQQVARFHDGETLQPVGLWREELDLRFDGADAPGYRYYDGPGWRTHEAILRQCPDVIAAMGAIRAAEGREWWLSRPPRERQNVEDSANDYILARVEAVLSPRAFSKWRESLTGPKGREDVADRLVTLIHAGDEALRWSPPDRAFVLGKAERPLFARFIRGVRER